MSDPFNTWFEIERKPELDSFYGTKKPDDIEELGDDTDNQEI